MCVVSLRESRRLVDEQPDRAAARLSELAAENHRLRAALTGDGLPDFAAGRAGDDHFDRIGRGRFVEVGP